MQGRVARHNFHKQFLIDSCWWEVWDCSVSGDQTACLSFKRISDEEFLRRCNEKKLKRPRELCDFAEHWSLVLLMTLFRNQGRYPFLYRTISALFVAFILFWKPASGIGIVSSEVVSSFVSKGRWWGLRRLACACTKHKMDLCHHHWFGHQLQKRKAVLPKRPYKISRCAPYVPWASIAVLWHRLSYYQG